ncbi:hypothetical protein EJB05_14486, partial [Eragrostis curvula]
MDRWTAAHPRVGVRHAASLLRRLGVASRGVPSLAPSSPPSCGVQTIPTTIALLPHLDDPMLPICRPGPGRPRTWCPGLRTWRWPPTQPRVLHRPNRGHCSSRCRWTKPSRSAEFRSPIYMPGQTGTTTMAYVALDDPHTRLLPIQVAQIACEDAFVDVYVDNFWGAFEMEMPN